MEINNQEKKLNEIDEAIRLMKLGLQGTLEPIAKVLKSGDNCFPSTSTIKSVFNKLNTIWFRTTQSILLEHFGSDKVRELEDLRLKTITCDSLEGLNEQIRIYGDFLAGLEINLKMRQEDKSHLNQDDTTSKKYKNKNATLIFHPNDGFAEYRGNFDNFNKGKKHYVLLNFLNNSKNTSFIAESIIKNCNPHINNAHHKFKGEKDIRDTVNRIRSNLKVSKGEFFPIKCEPNCIIWLEKRNS